jgi:hypothetical protein
LMALAVAAELLGPALESLPWVCVYKHRYCPKRCAVCGGVRVRRCAGVGTRG